MNQNKILLVEDELVITTYIKSLIEEKGYKVIDIAKTGNEAITKAKELQPDVILIDISLKGNIDGIEAVKHIKETCDIPFIYITGNTEPYTFQKAMETNPVGVITKPLREDELFTLIKSAILKNKIKTKFKWSIPNYKTIFDNMKSGVAVYQAVNDGEDFVFVAFNKASEKIEKISADEVIGKKVTTVFPSVKELGLFDVFQRVYKTGKPESLSTTKYEDERIRGWRDNYVYKLPDGEIVAIYSDETAKKQLEEKVNRQNEMFNNIAELSPTAITVVEKTGKIIYANKYAQKLLGITKSEINRIEYNSPEWNISDFYGNPYYDEKLPFNIIMRTKDKVYDVRHAIHIEGQGRKYLSINGAPIFNSNGKIEGIIFNIEDITEKVVTEEALQKKNEELHIMNEQLRETNEEFESTNEELKASLDELEYMNNQLLNNKIKLKKRLRELSCLYKISKMIDKHSHNLKRICKDTANIIPELFKKNLNIHTKISYKNKSVKSNKFPYNTNDKHNNLQLIHKKDIFLEHKNIGKIEIFYDNELELDDNDEELITQDNKIILSLIAERLTRIIERIKVEKQLKKEKHFIRDITDNIPVLVSYMDKNKKYKFVNNTYKDTFKPSAKIINNTIENVLGDNYTDEVKENINKVLSGETAIYEMKRKVHNEVRNYKVNYIPNIVRGEVIGFYAMIIDITESKKSKYLLKEINNKLQRSESRYKAVVEDQTELVIRFLENGILTFVNETYCKYMNKTKEELIGRSFLKFLSEDEIREFEKHHEKLSIDNPFIKYKTNKTIDGKIIWFEWIDRIISDEDNNIIEYQGVGRDITKEVIAFDKLRNSVKE
ncbi:MAG: PAS domain S-box protein, partial [Spirochaetota bacterium]